jgi:N-methylhydantoinase B
VESSAVDPITFEILSHRLHQIAKEMGTTLERVGGTVNTTQQHDYMASLYRANGDILATGESMGWHVACAGFAVKRIIERFEGDGGIYPDDIFLINDPYLTAIHQSDVYMVSPIHFREWLVGWSATFVHVMDIGAMSPGGNSPGAKEICQEGVRIPGVKIVERGRLRKDVFDMIVGMTRQPVMVGLDLKCEVAANNVAKTRMQGMYGQYGAELVDAVSQEMIRYSEAILRRRLEEIGDGEWREEAEIEAEERWRVVLRLSKVGDRLVFDFTGTDKQARTGINLPYHATFGACFEVVLGTLGYDIPKNHGVMRPLEVIAPKGTVVNVQYPAPVSMNTTSGGTIAKYLASSVLMQMLATSESWRNEIIAQSLGHRFPRHAGVNQHGRYYVSTLLELSGNGATPCRDGIDSGGRLTCHNVEWAEMNFPLLYLFRRHTGDGPGAGKFRGGAGVEAALTVHDAPEGKIKGVSLGVAGLRNSGQGMLGGYPAAPSVLTLYEKSHVNRLAAQQRPLVNLADAGGSLRDLAYCDFDLAQDDILYIRAGSGGGYGDPLERDAGLVRRDVLNGVVSKEAARDIYGVVLGSELDSAATERLRALLRKGRLKAALLRGRPAAVGKEDRAGSIYPPREVLEVCGAPGGEVIRCRRCSHVLCGLGKIWREACKARLLPPTDGGTLMEQMAGHFLLQQLYCPSCGALLDTRLVEEKERRGDKTKSGRARKERY